VAASVVGFAALFTPWSADAGQRDAAPAPKVLRLISESETGFDPARVGDARSMRVNAHIFETLLRYDPLARPVKLRPQTAAALPEASEDFRTWTLRLQPGIRFSDDPAFGGKARELDRKSVV
jgi:ABC-type transport system substrate-binding protein